MTVIVTTAAELRALIREEVRAAVAPGRGRAPSSPDDEPDGPVRVTAADLERIAQRRAQRGVPKRRRR
jgi:hypothetical protein